MKKKEILSKKYVDCIKRKRQISFFRININFEFGLNGKFAMLRLIKFKDQEIKLHFLDHIVVEKIYFQTVFIYLAEHQRQKYKFVTINSLKHFVLGKTWPDFRQNLWKRLFNLFTINFLIKLDNSQNFFMTKTN